MPEVLFGRVSIENEGHQKSILIPSKKRWSMLFVAAWLAMWITLPLPIVLKGWRALVQPNSAEWFAIFWSVGWLFGIAFAVWTIAWGLGGKELLRLSHSELELSETLFGFVLRRRLSPTAEVRNLRFTPASVGNRRSRESCISYENSKQTIKFGDGLNDGEAFAISEEMLKVHPFPKKGQALKYLDLDLD